MRITSLFGCILWAGLAVPAIAQNGGPISIQPSTPWQVDFGDARCRATRIFGEGDERTILMLEQIAPSDTPRWVMAGGVAEVLRSGGDLSVQFGPGLPAWEMRAQKDTTLGDFGYAYRGSSIRKPDMDINFSKDFDEITPEEPEPHVGLKLLDVEEGKSIDWVEFNRGDHGPRRLETGNFGQLFEILNTCMSDLVRTWGVDIEAHTRLASEPKPLNLKEIAHRIQRYYPSKAKDWGKQADLNVRVMVDKNGNVSECRITNISKAEDFDDRACVEFAKIGKFEPARDLDGAPMDSFYVTSVLYRMN